jgi:hypothetical protein
MFYRWRRVRLTGLGFRRNPQHSATNSQPLPCHGKVSESKSPFPEFWHPAHSPLNPDPGWDHVRLPWSIPFYTFGAIFLEYLLRLGALCIGF